MWLPHLQGHPPHEEVPTAPPPGLYQDGEEGGAGTREALPIGAVQCLISSERDVDANRRVRVWAGSAVFDFV